MTNYSYKLGFIGAGNMGKAIASGILSHGLLTEKDILMSDIAPNASFGNVKIVADAAEVLKNCEYVILSVKPQIFPAITDNVKAGACRCLISIMAGVAVDTIRSAAPDGAKVIRVMPNTPCSIGRGITAIAQNDAGEECNAFAKSIFDTTGETVSLPESLFDAVTGVSGSGPAYVYYFIRSMIRGGVDAGLDEAVAEKLTLATVQGAAEMVRRSSDDLDTLIDKVCSKGGTTIQAVNCFDEKDFDGVVREGMARCVARSKELGKS